VRSATSSTPRVDRSPKTSTPFQGLRVVSGRPLKLVTPLRLFGEPGKADLRIDEAPNVTPYVVTAAAPRRGRFWMKWTMKARAEATGTFDLTIQQYGDTWLYVNGRMILGSPGLHARDDTALPCSHARTRVHLRRADGSRLPTTSHRSSRSLT